MYNHLCEEHARKLLMELMTNNYRAKSIIGCYYFRFMLVAVTREARIIMHESFTDILILFCSRMGGGLLIHYHIKPDKFTLNQLLKLFSFLIYNFIIIGGKFGLGVVL